MLDDTKIFLRPAVLYGSVEQGIVCFPHVGFAAAWARVFIDDRGGAQNRSLVFVRCEE